MRLRVKAPRPLSRVQFNRQGCNYPRYINDCGGLNKIVSHKLKNFSTWSLVVGGIWRSGVALLKEVGHWGQALSS